MQKEALPLVQTIDSFDCSLTCKKKKCCKKFKKKKGQHCKKCPKI